MTSKGLLAYPGTSPGYPGSARDWTEEEYLSLTDHTTRLVEFTDGFLELLPYADRLSSSDCAVLVVRI